MAPMKTPCLALLALALPASAATLQAVEFESRDRAAQEMPMRITGRFAHPSPGTVAPAIVMLHGCSGLWRRDGGLSAHFQDLAELALAEGYAVLLVDSFTPRSVREVCTQRYAQRSITPRIRSNDAGGALEHLASRPDVDPRRIALLGWSHGGSTVLASVLGERPGSRDFAAAIAYYPGCRVYRDRGLTPRVPVLMLLGEADDWTPADQCLKLQEEFGGRGSPVEVRLYPGAHHGFDAAVPVRMRHDVPNMPRGVTVGGHPAARTDSRQRLLDYLRRQLGG